MELNIGTSVFKREDRPAREVISLLQGRGWEKTGTLGDRVTYMENSGIGITVIQGAAGTLIIPSGPIRGMVFGRNNKLFSNVSVIGAGKRNKNERQFATEASNRSSNRVIH